MKKAVGRTKLTSRYFFLYEKKRAAKARDFPENTCAASRHVQMIAESIGNRKPYDMLTSEPEHCAAGMLSTVASLWEMRTKFRKIMRQNERLKAKLKALDTA